jgi:hypothetical protein
MHWPRGPRTVWSLRAGYRRNPVRNHRRGTARKETEPTVRSADCLGGDHPRREVGTGRVDSWEARSEDLGVRRRYHGRAHPGAGCPAGLRRVSGRRAPRATNGQRGNDTVASRSAPTIIAAYPAQRRSDPSSTWDSGDGATRGDPGGGERPCRNQLEGLQRRTVHCQDISSGPTESACQDREYHRSRPDFNWRYDDGPLRTSHVGSASGRHRTPIASDTRACEQFQEVISGAKPNLDTTETQKLEKLITGFQDVFATKGGDFRHADRGYHLIDTGDAWPIRQPPSRLPLAKQAVVNVFDDMKEKGQRSRTALGRRPSCSSGRRETFVSAWTTGSWMTSINRTASRCGRYSGGSEKLTWIWTRRNASYSRRKCGT